MGRMLAKTRPGHKGTCRHARRGCTCYFYRGAAGRKAHVLRRRAQRHQEKAALRRGEA